VVSEASRQGSLDGAIRGATANQLRDYAATHPRLRAIAFNGKTAAKLGRTALGDMPGLRLIDLPSSSPAYTLAIAAKVSRWEVLGPLASPAEAATLDP
jgi:hypoxanthine-DNA glycosylase